MPKTRHMTRRERRMDKRKLREAVPNLGERRAARKHFARLTHKKQRCKVCGGKGCALCGFTGENFSPR